MFPSILWLTLHVTGANRIVEEKQNKYLLSILCSYSPQNVLSCKMKIDEGKNWCLSMFINELWLKVRPHSHSIRDVGVFVSGWHQDLSFRGSHYLRQVSRGFSSSLEMKDSGGRQKQKRKSGLL